MNQKSYTEHSLKKDSLQKVADATVPAAPVKDSSTYTVLMNAAHLPFNQPPVFMITKEREPQTKNELFYLLTGVVFLVAFVKLFFPKYFQNLFRLFFQTSFRQKQTRDQLLQDNLASLLMNLLFFISGGIYIGLVAQEMELVEIPFWNLLLYCSLLLVIIYLGKYLFLRFSGWVFNVQDAAGTYIFVVFLINKIVGVLLVPFLLLLAFSVRPVVQVTATVSLIMVAAMLVYRYLVSMGTIRRDLKVNALHFFLYLCAVEILPLLLIYKTLFNYISKNV